MNRASIRRRVFWALVAVGTVPLGIAVLVLAARERTSASPAGPLAALEEITASSRGLLQAADTAPVAESVRTAIETHLQVVASRTSLARRAETVTRTAASVLAVVTLITGVLTLAGSIALARRWSGAITEPVDELIEWVGHIGQAQPLPAVSRSRSPEYDELRRALRTMSENLERARAQAIERERLGAFQETARRVAHEIRGPLTAIRLAIGQLADQPGDPVDVLTSETDRLDRLAREFSEFGRLASGPVAPVDLHELMMELVTATLDSGMETRATVHGDPLVPGRYEALRRAFQNILSNAVTVTDGRGIAIETTGTADAVSVRIMDHGPGVPAGQRESIFLPYVTSRAGGTGLGLAIARQAVHDQGGTIRVEDTPGGGATFVVTLPRST